MGQAKIGIPTWELAVVTVAQIPSPEILSSPQIGGNLYNSTSTST
jgi:hypothetical protein